MPHCKLSSANSWYYQGGVLIFLIIKIWTFNLSIYTAPKLTLTKSMKCRHLQIIY